MVATEKPWERTVRPNPVRERLGRGETVFGVMVMECTNPGLPQIFAGAGADFIMYDQEAGCLDIAAVKLQAALCRGLGVAPMVNVPWHDYSMLTRALDCGAMGLMVPVVQTEAEAHSIARITHYPPAGTRGVAFGIAHDDYATADIGAAMQLADARTLVAVKIETAQGVENAHAIAAVRGIDVLFVGHMDLSVSLGIPGRYDDPRFIAARDKVMAACRAHGKAGGCLSATPDLAREWMAAGFRFVLYGTDVMLLANGFSDGLRAIRR
jgi:2-keto-3-deoxy-L-rhamnonate aldolase RhmA